MDCGIDCGGVGCGGKPAWSRMQVKRCTRHTWPHNSDIMVTALVQHMSQQLGVVGGGVARNLLVPNADVQQSSVKLNENKREQEKEQREKRESCECDEWFVVNSLAPSCGLNSACSTGAVKQS